MNIQKIYEYALQREEEGYRYFHDSAAKASHAAAAHAFSKLAEEELHHITFIKNLLAAPDGETADMAEPVGDGWFEERARREFLDQCLIESMIPDVAVLRTAYLIERDRKGGGQGGGKSQGGVCSAGQMGARSRDLFQGVA